MLRYGPSSEIFPYLSIDLFLTDVSGLVKYGADALKVPDIAVSHPRSPSQPAVEASAHTVELWSFQILLGKAPFYMQIVCVRNPLF